MDFWFNVIGPHDVFCATFRRAAVSLLRFHLFRSSHLQFRQFVDSNIHKVIFLHVYVSCFIIIIIILLFWKFFIAVLADSFSLEFERKLVSSSLQDSTEYSCWS